MASASQNPRRRQIGNSLTLAIPHAANGVDGARMAAAPVQLTTNPETVESEPAWSPDGQYIVYVSNEGRDNTGTRNNDIWIMRAEDTDRRQLTTNGSDDVSSLVDPKQRCIYFVSNRGFRCGIWRMPWVIELME